MLLLLLVTGNQLAGGPGRRLTMGRWYDGEAKATQCTWAVEFG